MGFTLVGDSAISLIASQASAADAQIISSDATFITFTFEVYMVKTNHGTAVSARRELSDAGFLLAFSSPGMPEKWQQPPRKGRQLNGSAYTVARLEGQQSTAWEIMDYPQIY